MNLDLAMQRLAEVCGAGGHHSAVETRQVMLDLMVGRTPPGLPKAEAEALHRWLRAEYGAGEDPAGALYQAMLGRVVEQAGDGTVSVRRDRRAHRATGAYYTENPVVTYMLRQARTFVPALTRVLDPACGSGAFLAGAAREFPSAELMGVDADPIALDVCRRNVPGARLLTADALIDDLSGGYDLCVGNPPYISSGLRGAAAQDPGRQRRLKERYPRSSQYKVNTYPLFIERGLELIREGGVLGFIVPDSFLSGRYFAGLRRLLLENTLLELTLIREDFWTHGRVGQSVILFVQRGAPSLDHVVQVRVCPRVTDLATEPAVPVAQQDLAWGPLQRFPLITDGQDRNLVRRMESAGGVKLGSLFRSYSGLIAKNGQKSLLRSASPQASGPWGRLLRSGKEIDRYHLTWEGEEVCLDPARIKSGGQLSHYQRPKILLRQTADSLRAVYDDQGYYCLNNIHLLIPRLPETPVRPLLGIINSTPVNRFYRAVTMETGRLYPQVDLDLVEALPFPPLTEGILVQLERLVSARESATSDAEVARFEAEIDELVEQAYGLV